MRAARRLSGSAGNTRCVAARVTAGSGSRAHGAAVGLAALPALLGRGSRAHGAAVGLAALPALLDRGSRARGVAVGLAALPALLGRGSRARGVAVRLAALSALLRPRFARTRRDGRVGVALCAVARFGRRLHPHACGVAVR